MASNMALKRAAKANRRKAVVAEKRKLELFNDTLPAKAMRAAGAPIQGCFVSETLFEAGIGPVVLARGMTPSHVTLGVFLVDVWSLGVKDAYLRNADGQTFDRLIAAMNSTTPMAPVDPGYARKLLRDATAWAAAIGFAPHRDFAAVERLFGDVSADASDATFRFGHEGKPLYVPGPTETPAQVRKRLEQLRGGTGAAKLEFVPAGVERDADLT